MKNFVDVAIAVFLAGFVVVLMNGCESGLPAESGIGVAHQGQSEKFAVVVAVNTQEARLPEQCTVDCDDNNACTVDTCNNGQCINTSKGWDCWPCSTDEDCSLGMVTCQGDGLIHEDGYGVCLPDKTCEVFHKLKSCDDGNSCTVDACSTEDNLVFCENVQVSCNDGMTCTVDTCDVVTGKCQHDQSQCDGGASYGPDCTAEADCNDGNPCTSDPCWEGECWGHPFGCDDNNPCTNDTCDTKQVCGHQAIPGCKP